MCSSDLSRLNSPRAGLGGAVAGAPRNPVADTLKELLEGVAEIERHARRTDPRNAALLNKFMALTTELKNTLAVAEGQGMARLGATLRGQPTGSGGSSGSGPF